MWSRLHSPSARSWPHDGSERIHLYFAELFAAAHGQDQDADENVSPVVMSEVEEGIRNGTIFDAKTLSAWLCWKLAR